MAFVLLRTTLLDFPGRVAAAVFLPGCHLRCPYCHNPELVSIGPGNNTAAQPAGSAKPGPDSVSPFNCDTVELDSFLKHRAKRLGGIVISGGEPLLNPELPEILDIAEEHGLDVKLDTAGLLPGRLEKLLNSPGRRIRYVAMDLKTRPSRYGELGWKGGGASDGSNESGHAGPALEESIRLLSDSNIDWEIRTTIVPGLVNLEVLQYLESLTLPAPTWYWQAYYPGTTLDPNWSDLSPPREEVIREWRFKMGDPSRIALR